MDGRELVAAYFDNTLCEADSARLAVWIAESAENARFFAEWSVLEDHIGERYGVAEVIRAQKQVSSQASLSIAAAGGRNRLREAGPWLLAAAAVVLLASLASVWGGLWQSSGPATVAVEPPAPEVIKTQPVAMLVGQRGAVWGTPAGSDAAAPVPGDRIDTSEKQLLQGIARLRTEGGTDLFIEGPARFVLEDAQTLRMVTGRVYGDASTSNKSFSVKSDRLDLSGCDQSFAMQVGDGLSAMCQVYAGTAEVLARNGSGDVEHVSRLMPNQSLTVDADGRVNLGRVDPAAFVRTMEPSQLGVGRDYVQAVRDSGPTDYWRFEQLDGGDLHNDIPGRPSLRIQSVGGGLNLSDDIQNRHLHRTDITGEFLVSTEKLTIDSDRYSVECWVRNDHADAWTTLFAFQVFPAPRTELEFGLIQLEMLPQAQGFAEEGHRFMLTHADEAGRFQPDLSSPPDRDAASWHHIVLVRDGPMITLFRDGKRWATHKAHLPGTTMDAVLVVGRNGITPGGNFRLFRGALDEVAIYDRALTESEIRNHYHAMDRKPNSPGDMQ